MSKIQSEPKCQIAPYNSNGKTGLKATKPTGIHFWEILDYQKQTVDQLKDDKIKPKSL